MYAINKRTGAQIPGAPMETTFTAVAEASGGRLADGHADGKHRGSDHDQGDTEIFWDDSHHRGERRARLLYLDEQRRDRGHARTTSPWSSNCRPAAR